MKISALLQSLSNPAATQQTQKEKSTSEVILSEYQSQLPKSVSKVLDQYHVNLSADEEKQISNFLKDAKGTDAQKSETIEIALYKGIKPTEDNLMALHQAVTHDEKVLQSLGEVTAEEAAVLKGEDAIEVIEATRLDPTVKEALKLAIKKGASLRDAVIEVSQIVKAIQTGNTTSLNKESLGTLIKLLDHYIKTHPEALEMLPKIEGKMAQMKALEDVSNISGHSTDLSSKVGVNESAVTHDEKAAVTTLNKNMQSTIGVSGHSVEDSNSENSLTHVTSQNAESIQQTDAIRNTEISKRAETESASDLRMDAESLDEQDPWLSHIEQVVDALLTQSDEIVATLSESLNLKTYLVESTTEQTIQAKKAFDTFKNESMETLEKVNQALSQATTEGKVIPSETSAQMISKVIEKLNTLLMKSEMGLLTDMFTEKKLLMMSSELEKAQDLLKQGNVAKAQEIAKSALKLLQDIQFNPSQRQIQVMAKGKLDQLEMNLMNREAQQTSVQQIVRQQIEGSRDQQGNRTAREMLETLRLLGLNHEMEVAEHLEKSNARDWQQSNVKELLLKLMKDDIQDRRVDASAEQNLMNFSGQQMMNDSQQKDQPFYFFNIPVLRGEELGNMKVYMKGASKNQQLDWQNTEVYFGVQVDAHRELGIKVKVTQGTLNVTVMGDVAESIREPMQAALDELSQMGYEKGELVIQEALEARKISLKPQTLKHEDASRSSWNEDGKKGFDFKV